MKRAGVSPAPVIRTGWKACATDFKNFSGQDTKKLEKK